MFKWQAQVKTMTVFISPGYLECSAMITYVHNDTTRAPRTDLLMLKRKQSARFDKLQIAE